jgi:hypothetical protein
MTVTITPTKTTNKLRIRALAHCGNSGGTAMTLSIFQDSTANAIVSGSFWITAVNQIGQINIEVEIAAGTTSATTFKVRIGCTNVGTTTFNGAGGNRYLGGTLGSHITVEEYTN